MSREWFDRLTDAVMEYGHASWWAGESMTDVGAGAARLAAFQKVLEIAQEQRRPNDGSR